MATENPNQHPDDSHRSADCLTLEQLIDYSEGRVPLLARVKLEYHIKGCELCADAVEGMASLSDTGKVAQVMQELKSDFATQTQRVHYRRRKLKIYGSAGLVFVFVAIAALAVFLTNQPNPVDSFLQPYPNTVPMVRSQVAENPLLQAMVAYEAAEYGKAAKIFDDYLKKKPENVTANFYAGVSKLLNGKFANAIKHLEKVKNNDENPFAEPAAWYFGLAYLKKNDRAAARKIFDEIIERGGTYQAKCEAILLILEERKK